MRFLLAILMILVSVTFGVKLVTESKIEQAQKGPQQVTDKSASALILKYSQGLVNLYKGETVIDTFYEVNIDNLPPSDKQSLLDGITINSIEDAYRLIEDFDG